MVLGPAPSYDTKAIRRRLEQQYQIVTPPEELDMATVGGLAERLRAIEPNTDVTIDLRNLDFCGATGLSLLIEADERLAAQGSSLTLSHPPPAFIRLLKLCGLERRFRLRQATARRARHGGADPARR